MEQRVRELVDEHANAGDFDQVMERITAAIQDKRDQEEISSIDLTKMVVEAINGKFEGRLDDIPEDLRNDLLDLGYLTISNDEGLAAMRKRLTKEELEVVNSLESHLSVVQTNALIVSLQNGTSPINARVLSALTWHGLQALSMIMDQAAARLFEAKSKAGEPDEALEQAYEDLCDLPLFFPEDSDEFEMGEDEMKAKRRENESAMLDRVNFFKPAKPRSGLGRGMR